MLILNFTLSLKIIKLLNFIFMAKRNVMLALNQTPDGSLPKNGFDLSHFEFSTSKLGQFRPIGCIETVPDADYDVGVDNFTFTVPCNTASLGKMKENFYFLYVPYSQLVNNAYSFFVQRKDNQSALDYNDVKIPFFKLGDVVYRCIAGALGQIPGVTFDTDIHGFNIYEGALRLLDMLGYGCYLDLLEACRNYIAGEDGLSLEKLQSYCTNILNLSKPNILRIAAYQKAWYCYFRNPIFDTTGGVYNDVTPRSFNFDDVVYHVAGQSESYDVMDHRDIDHFIFECLQIRYVGYKKDLFTAFMPGTQYGAVSTVGLVQGATFNITGGVSGVTGNDYSRWLVSATNFTESGSAEDEQSIVRSRIGPSVDTEGSVHQPNALKIAGAYYNSNSQEYDYGYFAALHDHTFSANIANGSGAMTKGTSLFDVLQLVEAQAVQKWKQKSMMAGQRGINQYRAHYGVVPRHMEDHYPDFLGSVDNEIMIDRLVSQANTASDVDESTNLGDLGGRGYGASDNRTFHCHSTEHGVIMVFAAIIPENTYPSYGLDRANMLINYTDFWQPEYQNIGLESVPQLLLDVNCRPYNPSNPVVHPDSENWPNTSYTGILGYAPRNYQLKMYPSKVHGRMNPTRLLSFKDTGYLPYGFSDLQHFVLPRLDLMANMTINNQGTLMTNVFLLTRKLFYVSPSMADSVFMIDADSSENTDVFIHKTRIICKSIQPLSVLGLPQF